MQKETVKIPKKQRRKAVQNILFANPVVAFSILRALRCLNSKRQNKIILFHGTPVEVTLPCMTAIEKHLSRYKERTAFFNAAAQEWNEQPDCSKKEYLAGILQKQLRHAHPGESILDIGCGTGILFPLLQNFIVTGIDLSPAMVIRAQAQKAANVKEVLVADVHALPFVDNQFDHAVMLAVFPHLHSHEIALREIHRVLKNNGTLSIIHTESRHVVNSIHASIGGAVANDMLPETNILISMLHTAGFFVFYQEVQEGFSFIAKKI